MKNKYRRFAFSCVKKIVLTVFTVALGVAVLSAVEPAGMPSANAFTLIETLNPTPVIVHDDLAVIGNNTAFDLAPKGILDVHGIITNADDNLTLDDEVIELRGTLVNGARASTTLPSDQIDPIVIDDHILLQGDSDIRITAGPANLLFIHGGLVLTSGQLNLNTVGNIKMADGGSIDTGTRVTDLVEYITVRDDLAVQGSVKVGSVWMNYFDNWLRLNSTNMHAFADGDLNNYSYGLAAKNLSASDSTYTATLRVTGDISNAPLNGLAGAVVIDSDLDVEQPLHVRGAIDNPDSAVIQVNDTVNATNVTAGGKIGYFYRKTCDDISVGARYGCDKYIRAAYKEVWAFCDSGDIIIGCSGYQYGGTNIYKGALQTVGRNYSSDTGCEAAATNAVAGDKLEAHAWCFDPTRNN